MKTKHLLLIGLALVLICFAVMTVMGRTCVYTLRTVNMPGTAEDYTVTFDPEPAPVELVDRAMAQDYSWERSASKYQEMYDWLIG